MGQPPPMGSGTGSAFFSGSYLEDDVQLLLESLPEKRLKSLYKKTENKELLIQTGQAHYSEMLSREYPPEPEYEEIFQSAMARHGQRVAREVSVLARKINETIEGPISLCSLVRAGVPVGVLLQRALNGLNRDVHHYGISIVRDRGVDTVAIDKVLSERPAQGVVFVDGWTGKGAISTELESAVDAYGKGLLPRLVTLADPAGRAWMSASHEDWLIPSGILGSTVSGLISRSVITEKSDRNSGVCHGVAYLKELETHDLSKRYVDEITNHGLDWPGRPATTAESARTSRDLAESVIASIANEFGIRNRNRIKPGIAEATRAVLRRVPHKILISSTTDPDLLGIQYLAKKNGVDIEERATGLDPYRAVTIIADVTKPQAYSMNQEQ